MNERDRLLMIMESEHLNAKQFAEEVGISAGTLSNISGGRNKPSLDVMQAVLRRFRAISSQWLILGEGSMYLREGDSVPQQTTTPQVHQLTLFPENDNEENVSTHTCAEKPKEEKDISPHPLPRTVTKLMLFYSDGTYEER